MIISFLSLAFLLFFYCAYDNHVAHACEMAPRFLRGDQYAIALALLHDGKVVLGVLACPNLPLASISSNQQHSGSEVGCLFFAKVGEGTYMQTLGGSTQTRVCAYRILSYLKLLIKSLTIVLRSIILLSLSRCMSVLLRFQKKQHSLNLLKQHTPHMTCLVPLQK